MDEKAKEWNKKDNWLIYKKLLYKIIIVLGELKY